MSRMCPLQPLAELFTHLALRVRAHGSDSASIAGKALAYGSHQLEKRSVSGSQVPQCAELVDVLTSATSETLRLLHRAQALLRWTESAAGSKPDHVQRTIAAVELAGPSGMVIVDNCRVGLFLLCRNSHYPAHHHAAAELYCVLHGEAHWSRSGLRATSRSPGEFIAHEPWEFHSMTTTSEPLLALWCWTGDTRLEQYKLLSDA